MVDPDAYEDGTDAFGAGETLRSAVERFDAVEAERQSEDEIFSWLLGYVDALVATLRRGLPR